MVDGQHWTENPLHILNPAWRDFAGLWMACRGDFGIAHWPDAGGVAHQSAWVVEAFQILNAAAAQPKGQQ